ncbi:MAG: hypothetical protein AABX28_01770 [Nanoarchaeota archaeon]
METEEQVEEIEFVLDSEEIDWWISELARLKENKEQIELEINDETFLKINYGEND